MVGVPGAGKKEFAEFAGVERVYSLDHPRPTAALVAHLNDALVLAGSSHYQFAFVRIVAAGVFYLFMLASSGGENSCAGAPVIGNGARNGIDSRIFEDAPKIFCAFGFPLLFCGDEVDALLKGAAVHVANVGDLGARKREIAGDVVFASSVAANDGDKNLFVRAFRGAAGVDHGEGSGQASGKS